MKERELIEVPTKYGSVRFYKTCNAKKSEIQFSFIYGKMDNEVDVEAEKSNIKNDTVLVSININEKGYITNSEICRKGKLESFNIFIEKLFKEITSQMKIKNHGSLNCSNKNFAYVISANYKYN